MASVGSGYAEGASEKMECLRCGACCIYEEKGRWTDCKHLKRADGKTRCVIYGKHIGTPTGEGQHCTERIFSKYDYPGCPYNASKSIHPHYNSERKIIDEVCVMELTMRKWSDGTEDLGVKCQEELMVKHKAFLIKILTQAINFVMNAAASPGMIQKVREINKQMFRNFIKRR